MRSFRVTLIVQLHEWDPKALELQLHESGYVGASVTSVGRFYRVVLDVPAMSAEDAKQRVVAHINEIPGLALIRVEGVGNGFGYEPPDTSPSL